MRKATELRSWLIRSVPDLANHPDRLKTYLSKGGLDFQRSEGDSLSFGYRYELAVTITGFSASLDQLMVPLIVWLSQHEPQLIDHAGGDRFQFIVDQLDNDTSDIEIVLQLDEPVSVTPDPGAQGGYIAEHPQQRTGILIDVPTLSCLWLERLGGDRLLAAHSADADCQA